MRLTRRRHPLAFDVVAVTRRAGTRNARRRIVATRANYFLRQIDVRSLAALKNPMAGFAIHIGVFAVIEIAAQQPAVGNHRLRHNGDIFAGWRDLVTARATWKSGRAFRPGVADFSRWRPLLRAEENGILQIFAGEGLLALPQHLRTDKFFHVAVVRQAARAPGEIGVLLRQTAEKRAHRRHVAVRQS